MKKIFYSAAIAAIALGMTACGGKKSDATENLEEESMEFVDEFVEEAPAEAAVTSEYTCTPATTAVEGPVGEYVTVKDKTYGFEAGSDLGDNYYSLTFDFEVSAAHTFTEEIEIAATFYDENGNLVEFPTEDGGTVSKFYSFSNSLLQKALKSGANCDETSVLIRTNSIKDFTPEMLAKIKTFKVESKLSEDTEFDYED